MAERKSRYDVLIDACNLVLGTFLFLAPWMFDFAQPTGASALGIYDAWTCGAAIGLTAMTVMVEFSKWEWLNVAMGQWVAGAPWLLGFSMNPAARWVHVTVGFAVTGLAAFRLCLAEHRAQTQTPNDGASPVADMASRVSSKRGPLASSRPINDGRHEQVGSATIISLAASRARLMKRHAFIRQPGRQDGAQSAPHH